jgi:hypothetical protein
MPSPVEITPFFAVALFPDETGAAVRDVRVLVCDLFGARTLADAIGALVREVDRNGQPFCGAAREHWVPVQRLVAARLDASGRRTVPAAELAEKRAAYAERLAAGSGLGALAAAPVETAAAVAEPSPESRSWLLDHERQQEEAA